MSIQAGAVFQRSRLFYFLCGRGAVHSANEQHLQNSGRGPARDSETRAAVAGRPKCAGLLAGKGGVTELALRTQNAATNPEIEYQIAPKELFAAMRAIRESGRATHREFITRIQTARRGRRNATLLKPTIRKWRT